MVDHSIITPARYDFYGDINPDTIRWFYDSISNSPKLPPEIIHSSLLTIQLKEIITSMHRFGLRLGVDLSKRLPDEDDFHFFRPSEFKIVRHIFGKNVAVGFVMEHHRKILIEWEDRRPMMVVLSNANHELVHLVSYLSILLLKGKQNIDRDPYHGYTNNHTNHFHKITEAFTEIANLQIIKYFWRKCLTLKDLPWGDIGTSYYWSVLIVDEMTKKISRITQNSRRTVLAGFHKGMLIGDAKTQQLAHIGRILGSDFLEILSTMNPVTRENTIKIAKSLGLSDLVVRLKNSPSGEIPFLEWL